jgi:hypothetical protein
MVITCMSATGGGGCGSWGCYYHHCRKSSMFLSPKSNSWRQSPAVISRRTGVAQEVQLLSHLLVTFLGKPLNSQQSCFLLCQMGPTPFLPLHQRGVRIPSNKAAGSDLGPYDFPVWIEQVETGPRIPASRSTPSQNPCCLKSYPPNLCCLKYPTLLLPTPHHLISVFLSLSHRTGPLKVLSWVSLSPFSDQFDHH